MKWIVIINFVLLCILQLDVYGQEITVSAQVSKDTVLAGERLTITFKVEGGSISDFATPDFYGLQVLAGPNVSSSFSMLNGQVSQSASYSFVLRAISVGDIEVKPAEITVGQETFESDALKIHVLENPDQDIMDSLQEDSFRDDGAPVKKYKKKRKTYKI